ncbi:putative amidohydrolase [Tenacibaculum adriaticum]|uniref:Omega-amidase YafV n=1 Tax=Tenacibaculum adriaticum TaxID=413713 RepID=A0A5S5DX94_9FLAO|nr:nitrilase family protein [Tenacibaculum adriaticum]TYP99686.1 putative amidohydrolase [Tenacibaculum adriaticum]
MKTSEKLNIAIIQSDLIWENPEANRLQFERKVNQVDNATDLIILPEMFSTGFSMNASVLAETMSGETVQWMQKMASEKQLAIVGSIIISENDKFYNRLLFVYPSGKIEYYDKRHTFTLAKENEVFSEGKNKLIIEYKGWKICPLICYDLRFPVWSRNVENYDLLIYIASWPKVRISAWDALLKARAIENMCYTIGVNRTGKDGNNYEYVGHSIALDCLGNPLSKETNNDDEIILVQLDKTQQHKTREKLGFLNDKDAFILK